VYVQPDAEPRARWPERLIALGRDWSESNGDRRRRAIAEIWLIVNEALIVYLWRHCSDRSTEPEDVRDIASEKTLELLQRLHGGLWELGNSSPGRVSVFLSTTARNAWVDHLRSSETRQRLRVDLSQVPADDPRRVFHYGGAEGADTVVDRGRFVEAIKGCVAVLPPRMRRMWLLRVILGMNTRDIARHPDVCMKPAAVDVAMGRCRQRMVRCMKSKGFEPISLPPGTAAALWETFCHQVEEYSADHTKRTGERDEQFP
jgi:DNA-directed RNA polymerase specialized sigma24 family protein